MKKLGVFLLTDRRRYGAGAYSMYDDFVVIAKSNVAARLLVDRCGEECGHDRYRARNKRCAWLDPARTRCRLIGTAVPKARPRLITYRYFEG